jgi:hypothetical protein
MSSARGGDAWQRQMVVSRLLVLRDHRDKLTYAGWLYQMCREIETMAQQLGTRAIEDRLPSSGEETIGLRYAMHDGLTGDPDSTVAGEVDG